MELIKESIVYILTGILATIAYIVMIGLLLMIIAAPFFAIGLGIGAGIWAVCLPLPFC